MLISVEFDHFATSGHRQQQAPITSATDYLGLPVGSKISSP